jgi:hypothetical protein
MVRNPGNILVTGRENGFGLSGKDPKAFFGGGQGKPGVQTDEFQGRRMALGGVKCGGELQL